AYRAVLPKIVIIDTILTIMYFLVALLAWMSAIIYIYQVRKERHET
ncbi:MAG TPA: CDP-diacylglycerol--glycerol-3-phosphate 3-phosphatidyltransferase, partial [Candidatus Cloacimonetes bacterium]|nr:CDP-diacylglycerol--glycerol-3-phosphate 3-phosphatidyltransferase [Candidatus Cloacimonadota bacterium]